ncbi:formate/nitrate family transporter [Teratosphaeria nubilosa]|uniref:Formate/nitrate family transporter n=1 Tax=Teratosphaeria nubilosa TaxID=161662 RepID=A0A6G1LF59_9PEZI|nr:formate/nitrate family transporter [Teratosphaeria nubilosa]
MQSPVHVIVNCYTPVETVELCSRAGVAKATPSWLGVLLAFACAALLSTNTAPWYQENAPGLIRMIGALIFPFGLVTIVVTGADLCTGSFLNSRSDLRYLLTFHSVTFWGNLAGSLFVMAIIIGYGDVVPPEWHDIFLRGIGANWLVCLACFHAFSAREPTFAFVCLGLDHVVANMFFVPAAIFLGAPKITVGYYIGKSMVPALIGNIIGGGLFVGVVYWYLYLTGDTTPVPIDGASFADDKVPLVGQSVNGSAAHSTHEPSKTAQHMV